MEDRVRYFYAMRKHSEIERAHVVDEDETTVPRVTTLCGLSYRVWEKDLRESSVEDVTSAIDGPSLLCRNCKRSIN